MNRTFAAATTALLALAGSAAHATTSAQATLTDIQFTLVHLDPSDTSTPWVRFGAGYSWIQLQAGPDLDNSDGDPVLVVNGDAAGVPAQTFAVSGAAASGTVDGGVASGLLSLSTSSSSDWQIAPHPYALGWLGSDAYIELSADTRLIVTATGHVVAAASNDERSAHASDSIIFLFMDPTDGTSGTQLEEDLNAVAHFDGSQEFDDTFSLTVDNPLATMQTGDLEFSAFTAANSFDVPLSAVPEPATMGLWLVGLLGLGAVARRRAR